MDIAVPSADYKFVNYSRYVLDLCRAQVRPKADYLGRLPLSQDQAVYFFVTRYRHHAFGYPETIEWEAQVCAQLGLLSDLRLTSNSWIFCQGEAEGSKNLPHIQIDLDEWNERTIKNSDWKLIVENLGAEPRSLRLDPEQESVTFNFKDGTNKVRRLAQ